MRKSPKLFEIALLALCCLFLMNCGDDEQIESTFSSGVTSLDPTDLFFDQATLNGRFKIDESSEVGDHGFYWGTSSRVNESSEIISLGQSNNSEAEFSSVLEELEFGETYYYRTFLNDGESQYLGEIVEFKTWAIPTMLPLEETNGYVGDKVLVQFESLTPLTYPITVEVDGVETNFSRSNNDEIEVVIPRGTSSDSCEIVVSSEHFELINSEKLIVIHWLERGEFPYGLGHPSNHSPQYLFNDESGCYFRVAVYYPGYGGNYRTELWHYNLSTGSFQKKADFPFLLDPLFGLNTNAGMVPFHYEDQFYVIAGAASYYSNSTANEMWQYHPDTDEWSLKNDSIPLPARGWFNAYFSVGDKSYVGGGRSSEFYDLWEYNHINDSWRQLADGSLLRVPTTAQVLEENVYMKSVNSEDLLEYDVVNDSWNYVAAFPSGAGDRDSKRLFTYEGNLYLINTYDGKLWSLDPESSQWTVEVLNSEYFDRRDEMIMFNFRDRLYTGFGWEHFGLGPRINVSFAEYVR
jgi:hypothetical protein